MFQMVFCFWYGFYGNVTPEYLLGSTCGSFEPYLLLMALINSLAMMA